MFAMLRPVTRLMPPQHAGPTPISPAVPSPSRRVLVVLVTILGRTGTGGDTGFGASFAREEDNGSKRGLTALVTPNCNGKDKA